MAEAFQTNPQLWQDIKADLEWSINFTMDDLKGKNCANREWLAGYASGLEHAANLRRRMEIWKTENKIPKS